MSKENVFELPEIVAEDISWASCILGLPAEAFFGNDGADPRQEVLKSMECMDIAACPGSGKTTLLVAKLAILAEKWQHRTRGICVLSHTNAARHQIESRLGNAASGQCLLSYPHYVGTIHGFVGDLLALPWLRSQGYPIRIIDTAISTARRWSSLPFATRSGLEKDRLDSSVMSVKSPDFSVGAVRWGKGQLGTQTKTYEEIRNACQRSIAEGYLCYEELFVWASDLMDKIPSVVRPIRSRFPVLFIDEAQDNSEEQSAILYRIFMDGSNPVVRQRFGDCNQAIFDPGSEKEATTDRFACIGATRDLPNSHRFGQTIATLVDPLGLIPYDRGLQGHGPQKCLASGTEEGEHTIFLFGDDGINRVLQDYAELLLGTFSADELREGTFAAVGMIHRGEGEAHKPHHVGHYWAEYDSELGRTDPKPPTLVQYVLAGQAQARLRGESHAAVGKIADGICRLAGMAQGGRPVHQRGNAHRRVMALLEERADARERYEDFVITFAVKKEILTKEAWVDRWRGAVQEIAEAISGASLVSAEANDFLEWHDGMDVSGSPVDLSSRGNIFSHSSGGKEVLIQVGSIHSVKGQTHTATLVLETYWYTHNLESLLPWLSGDRAGAGAANDRQKYRLKVHYVAMTRPSHILCLAMKQSTFDGDPDHELLCKLGERGWHIRWLE